MQFLMLVCRDSEPVPPAEDVPDVEEWVTQMDSTGKRLAGDAVRPQELAKAVRVRGGKVLVDRRPLRPRPRRSSAASTCWSAPTWMRRSRWPRPIRWPTAGSWSCAPSSATDIS